MKRTPLILLLAMTGAHAESWLEGGLDHQHYSSGPAAGDTAYVAGSHREADRTLYGELLHYERFDHIDTQATAGIYQRMTADGKLHLEGSISPEALIKPRSAFYAGWYQALSRGWAIEPALQRLNYATVSVSRYSLLTEKYIGNWRGAYAVADVQLNGSSALNQRLQGDWFYGDRSRVGAGVAWGDDQESLASGVVKTPVRSVFVAGQHELSPRWSLTWQIQQIDQGDLYRQRGIRLGARYQF